MQRAVPLNVREITLSSTLGTPQDNEQQNTVIGLLKRIILLFG